MPTFRSEPFLELEARLAQRTESLKPSGKRSGVSSWFPYYAGYAPSFVSDTLIGLGSKPGWKILDPWNGSGTTSSVADQFGCEVFGYDINPVATLVASARLIKLNDIACASQLAHVLLTSAITENVKINELDPLLTWLSLKATKCYRAIELSILKMLGTKNGISINTSFQTASPHASFFLLCLIKAAKLFAVLKDNSNPTWVSPQKKGRIKSGALESAFLEMVKQCTGDMIGENIVPSGTGEYAQSIKLRDSKCLPLADESIDAVITSPPYCTRIDYFRATIFELAALGISPDGQHYRELRSKAMGTNLVRIVATPNKTLLSQDVNSLIENIRNHKSKASATYYYKHYKQYFEDADSSLREIHRVLKPGGSAILVVQSSYYKDLAVNLGDLFASMGAHIGFNSRVILKVPVRRVLASINPHARRYANLRIYTEDVVALKKEF